MDDVMKIQIIRYKNITALL